MDKQNLTDAEIDQIIAEVEQTLSKADNLNKSNKATKLEKAIPPKEDEMPSEEPTAPPQEDQMAPPPESLSPEAPADQAPPEESAPAPEEAPAEEPPPEEGQAPEASEEELSEDAPLTDEELDQIYGSLAPEEWERHYMAMRRNAPAEYSQQGQPEAPAPEAPAPEQTPAPEQPMAMSETDKQPELKKSEFDSLKEENAKLKEETESIKKSLDLMVKAIETGFAPRRKAVEGLEFIKKSAADAPEAQPLSKSEMKSKIDAFYKDSSKVSSLSKSDRNAIDNYLLDGTDKETVEKILNLGGKQ